MNLEALASANEQLLNSGIFLMLLAVVLDLLLGDLPWLAAVLPTPRRITAAFVDRAAWRLDRARRSGRVRMIRGAILVLFLVATALAAGLALQWLARHYPYGWAIELACLFSLFAQRGPIAELSRVRRALQSDSLENARTRLREVTHEDAGELDRFTVARRAIETAARRFCDRAVAPLFWYALTGLPGLFVYAAVNVADLMIGDRTESTPRFGMTAARLNDVLALIPARLAGLLVAFAALFVGTASPGKAFATLARDAGKAPAPSAGWPQAAAAGALGLALGGPVRIAGQARNYPWLGDGRARATATDMRRAAFLLAVACLLNVVVLAALSLVSLAVL